MPFGLEVRKTSQGARVEGYAAVFNSRSVNLGGFVEILKPGCFKKALNKTDARCLFNHNENFVLGRVSAGTLRLKEDDRGLFMSVDLPDTQIGRDLAVSIARGDINQQSFAFSGATDKWSEERGLPLRTITQVEEIWDTSIVTRPAYPETTAALRSLQTFKQARNPRFEFSKGSKNTMNPTMQKLLEERASIHADMVRITDNEDEPTGSNRDAWENLNERFETLTRQIDAEKRKELVMQRSIELRQPLNEPTRPHVGGDQRGYKPGNGDQRGGAVVFTPAEFRQQYGFDLYVNGDERGLKVNRGPIELKRSTRDYLEHWDRFLRGGDRVLSSEQRALFMDDFTSGGALVAPQQFVAELIKDVRSDTFALTESRVIVVENAHSLGVPYLDSEPDDAEWTSELRTGSEDTAMNFDGRELYPHPLAKRIKVSKKLLRAAPYADGEVKEALRYKISVPVEKNWLSGSGQGRPLGLFTVSAQGIDTDRDVSTGNTATAIKADGLIEAKYALKPQYRKRAKWLFSTDAIKMIRKLKDGNGDYLWKLGLSADRPDTILELPFLESEYAPNTFTASQYVGIIGDFSKYWFAVALDMQIQVLTELYAESNQNGYISRMECDGMPVVSNAFVRIQLAA